MLCMKFGYKFTSMFINFTFMLFLAFHPQVKFLVDAQQEIVTLLCNWFKTTEIQTNLAHTAVYNCFYPFMSMKQPTVANRRPFDRKTSVLQVIFSITCCFPCRTILSTN